MEYFFTTLILLDIELLIKLWNTFGRISFKMKNMRIRIIF